VILTYDATISGAMWLMADYLPEVAALDLRIFPPPEQLAKWLGGDVRIDKLPIPCDTPDWMLGLFWAHPERVFDANARAATSGFARMSTNAVDRVVSEVSRDLASGLWDDRYHRPCLLLCSAYSPSGDWHFETIEFGYPTVHSSGHFRLCFSHSLDFPVKFSRAAK